MEVMQQLSNKIKLLREVHNYTQEFVANELEISQKTYSQLEKGETKVTIDRIEKLAKLYKMDYLDLLKLNEQTFIQNITQSQGICSSKADIVTYNNPPSDEERKLYQATIQRLEQEIDRLHQLLDNLTGRL